MAPDVLIDVRKLRELQGIAADRDMLSIGAAVPHAVVAATPMVIARIPALAQLARCIGDPQVRNMGTIGGSVANNDPAADYPSAVLALDGAIRTNKRVIGAEQFFSGLYGTCLEPGELIMRIDLRIPTQSVYVKFRSAASRFAIVGVFVARFLDGSVRIAITGAGKSGVFRATQLEQVLTREFSVRALVNAHINATDLVADRSGSADYRAHLILTLTRRAVVAMGTSS